MDKTGQTYGQALESNGLRVPGGTSRTAENCLDEADPPFERALINGDSGCPRVDSLDPRFKRLIEEEEREKLA